VAIGNTQAIGGSNVGASVAAGAAAGSAFGPYGAAAGAVIGLITPYLNEDLRGGGEKMGSNLFGLSQQNSQHVTQTVLNPTDVLFSPSVNVGTGTGNITPSQSGNLTSTANPNIQPDQTVSPASNPLAGLYGQPGGGLTTYPYGLGGPGAGGPGIAANLSPTTLLLLGGLVLLLVMSGKGKHRR